MHLFSVLWRRFSRVCMKLVNNHISSNMQGNNRRKKFARRGKQRKIHAEGKALGTGEKRDYRGENRGRSESTHFEQRFWSVQNSWKLLLKGWYSDDTDTNDTVKPQFNEPLFNKNLDWQRMVLFAPVIAKYMKKKLEITNPQFNERIWPVPSDFHCISEILQFKISRAICRGPPP